MIILAYIRRHHFFFIATVSFVAWHGLLLIDNKNRILPLFLVGIFFCTLLPGLIVVTALGAKKLSLQTGILSVGLSFVFMLLVGLTANYAPLLFGSKRPLSLLTVMSSYDLWLLFIILWSANVNDSLPRLVLPNFTFSKRTLAVYILVSVGLSASVLGTFRLNNGADNFLSVIGFSILIINFIIVFLWRSSLPNHAYVITIIGLSVALLLVTSLRSNLVSGQDLKQEFRVYNITNNAAHWSIANFRDSYNACLSITLYPYTLVKLLGVDANIVFKLVYQVIFCICPLAVFLVMKIKVGKSLALAGTVFFLSLPTLGLDLPLQARQQMAFMLFSMVILVWFNHTEAWIKRHWHALFVIFSFAVIVSHYSTAYIFVGTLLLYYFLRSILLATKFAKNQELKNNFVLPGKIILLTFLFAVLWLGQVTAVSANLFEKLQPALSAFISAGKPDAAPEITPVNGQTNPLYGYIIKTKPEGAQLNIETYKEVFPVNDTLKASPPLRVLPVAAREILTSISKKLYYVVGIIFYPTVIIIGLGSLVFRHRKHARRFLEKPEYIVLSLSILCILVLQAILPGITADYGITRAFIQAFIILCVPFIYGIKELTELTKYKRFAQGVVVAGSVVMIATFSGLTNQLFGGIRPQMNFNNTGPYYGAFYVRKNDIEAYKWIEANISSPGNVSSPDYSFPTALAYIPEYRHYGGGIFPFQEHAGNYTLFNYTQTKLGVTYTTGSVLAVKLNRQSYNESNSIYSNGASIIYK